MQMIAETSRRRNHIKDELNELLKRVFLNYYFCLLFLLLLASNLAKM